MKKTLLLTLGIIIHLYSISQQNADSSVTLNEVTIRAFEQNRKERLTAAAVKIIDLRNGDRYNKSSMVNGFNTVAGVRMEERSPGSYRINIRGSSLRSPFGVRNIKVYWNGIPITDPGGNTYFNQFAWNNFSHMEIYKGPAGSMYGGGTGGLILLENFDDWRPALNVEYVTGSYNLQNMFGSIRFGKDENQSQLSYAHNQSNGYRAQSAMRRDNFSWMSKLKVSERQEVLTSVLFTDLFYETPGALTLSEYLADPKAARPATGPNPSSEDAKAAIYQKNFMAGFTHSYKITEDLINHTTFYGAYSNIKNPSIRNFERRTEPGFGGRTVFVWGKEKEMLSWKLTGGAEFQHGLFNTQVFSNVSGNPDTLQTNDDIIYTSNSYFVQADVLWKNNWILNGGISLNRTHVKFTRLSESPAQTQSRSYQNELAPRISAKKLFDNWTVKATIARGYSPPTISELLPSTGVISTDLEAEYGWNSELAIAYSRQIRRTRIQAEVTGFYFKLNNALVQRRDATGADFFVNAGSADQSGLEIETDIIHKAAFNSFLDHLFFQANITLNHFRYSSFVKNNNDYSGNTVPSVPAAAVSVLGDIYFRGGIYFNSTLYIASKIFLNDDNSASADPYQLLGCRLGWEKKFIRHRLNIYFGVDNILDENYSLGNDINGFGGRYYNAAPRRNYYAGISWQLSKANAN